MKCIVTSSLYENTEWTAYINYYCVEFVTNNKLLLIINMFTVSVLFHLYIWLNVTRLSIIQLTPALVKSCVEIVVV